MAKRYNWEDVPVEQLDKDEVDEIIGEAFRPRQSNSASGLLRNALFDCKKGDGRSIGPLTEDQITTARTVLPAVVNQLKWRKHVRGRTRVYKSKVEMAGGKHYLKIVRL